MCSILIFFIFFNTQSIGASLALKKWGDWNVALWVSPAPYNSTHVLTCE